ncbi:hypothetical protein NIES22_05930 [Calothrix brevissima NIES-22]|nr:hypothetical protein NIES22_05930 [Calothrix brevissima NIES-22]
MPQSAYLIYLKYAVSTADGKHTNRNPEVNSGNPEVDSDYAKHGNVNPEVDSENPEVDSDYAKHGNVNPEVDSGFPQAITI